MNDKKEIKPQVSFWSVLKRFTIVFFPLLALTISITLLFYYTKTKNIEEINLLLEKNEVKNVRLQVETIVNNFNSIISDLMILSGHYEVQKVLEGGGSHDRECLAEEFMTFCKNKGTYDQIRYLDETGKEIIRTNFNEGNPYITPEEQLQFKGKRYYFEDTFRLNKGEVFVSPFDLNIEKGGIEKPLKPMIRFGTPIIDKNGKKRGVIVLNYLGKNLIDKLKSTSVNTLGNVMLLNSDGFWLHGAKSEDEWGFMYEDKADATFGNTFPVEWQQIFEDESGHFSNANGMFTFETINPLQRKLGFATGPVKTFGKSSKGLYVKEYKWKIISHIAPEILQTRQGKAFNILLLICGTLTVAIGVGSWVLASASVHRKTTEKMLMESEERFRGTFEQAAVGVAHVALDGQFLLVNKRFCEITGYSEKEILKHKFQDITHSNDLNAQNLDRKRVIDGKTSTYKMQKRYVKEDGSIIWVNLIVALVHKPSGEPKYFIPVIEDITERIKAEEQIKVSLKEKEILLKEVHHRVKNNMQVISSLLNLQSKNIKDKQLIDIFKESQNRIRSMALIHEELYRTEDLAKVDFAKYTKNLASNIFRTYSVYSDMVLLRIIIDNVFLGVDTAIPCGLIINELLTNSLKYAFPTLITNPEQEPSKSKGEININFYSESNKYTLLFSDNGVGLPGDLDFRNTKSLGLELVNTLTQQLGGTIELDRSKGTEFKITFEV